MEWINVKDRLPKSGYGLLLSNGTRVCYGFLRTHPGPRAAKWKTPHGVVNDITHWMPLPDPPEAQP